MSLSIHQDGYHTKLLVLGNLLEQKDQEELIIAINKAKYSSIEIIFYDARLLPNKLLKLLAAYAEYKQPIKIKTYQTTLSQYLYKLGLESKQEPPQVEYAPSPNFKALALAGSANSLSSILDIIESLPFSDLSLFIVQHISENQANRLDELLKVRTDYSVLMPHNRMPIQASTIYIAPPAHHLRIHDQHIYLTRDRKICYARPSIQVLFESLAHEYQSSLMVALLSGYGNDGVNALKTLHHQGATILIESPDDSAASVLPQNALNTGYYDHILKASSLQSFFASAVIKQDFPDEPLIKIFLKAVKERYGYDFSNYQMDTLQRRIKVLLKTANFTNFFSLQAHVLTNIECFNLLFDSFSINVTTFFRAPQQLHYLREHILPVLDSFPHIKVWVAGCSSGEEAYSLAIIFKELNLLDKTIIYATDINPDVLYEAKNGLYSNQKIASYQDNYHLSGGCQQFTDYIQAHDKMFEVSSELRQKVLFFSHSLVDDDVFNEFQLIICRNVMIYFSNDLKKQVIELFSRSLHRDGYLTLGDTESIDLSAGQRYFKIKNEQQRVYKCLN